MSPSSALELRRAFDASFASEPAAPVERVDLLAVSVAGRLHAVRVPEIAGVVPFVEPVELPAEAPGSLGVTAVRGRLVAAYDLAALLGLASGGRPRWMLLSAGRDGVALAFAEVGGCLRVAVGDIAVTAPDAAYGAREIARVSSARLLPVVSIPALLRQLRDRLGPHAKES